MSRADSDPSQAVESPNGAVPRPLPVVSVVIVNYNGAEVIAPCLKSLESCRLPMEIIVYDNASTDDSDRIVERDFPDVRLRRRPRNERFARPNNLAMREASGEFILLLNNDTVVLSSAIERLVEYLRNHPEVGMAGPQLLNSDGTVQPSCSGFFTPWTHLFDMTFADRLFGRSRLVAAGPMTWFDFRTEREVDHLTAACVLMRRDALEDVGLFDERFTFYFNDMDLSMRFHAAGWPSVFVPSSRVIHRGGHATRKALSVRPEMLTEFQWNAILLSRKHYGWTGELWHRGVSAAGYLLRTVIWGLVSAVRDTEGARERFKTSLVFLKTVIFVYSFMQW